jgi:hypothetical protein
MKKQLLLLVAGIVFSITSLMAQGMQRQTPEEKTKVAMEKLAAIGLDDATKTKAEAVISDFYTTSQKAMDDMRASGSTDRDAFMAKRKELATARDAKLKDVLNAEQFKKWTDEIEPSLRPKRPQ